MRFIWRKRNLNPPFENIVTCFELVFTNLECVVRPEVTLCGWQDVKILELTN